jgi:phosphate butyryltransferase
VDVVTSFQTIIDSVKFCEKKTVVVVAAEEHDILAATVHAKQEGLADFLYVGDPERIQQLATEHLIDISGIEIFEEPDVLEAGRKAIQLIKEGKAEILMKGKISSGQILGMVLKDEDLKAKNTNWFLSHVSIFEWEKRLKLSSDSGLNIAPNIEEKRKIALNAIEIAKKLGMDSPRVAFLSAIEKVTPKMPSSVEAAELAKMDWGDAIVGGPLAFDGAMFEKAYRTKGVFSPVEGKADILIYPNIETGNLFYKTLEWIAKLDIAGIIIGASIPFIVTSRSDSARVKYLSIATSIYLAERGVIRDA